MRNFLILLILLNMSSFSFGRESRITLFGLSNFRITSFNGVTIHLKDDHILIRSKQDEELYAEITDNYRFYIDHRLINTSRRSQPLVEEYYNLCKEIVMTAEELGKQAPGLGLDGIEAGLRSAVQTIKMLMSEVDDEVSEEIESIIEEKVEQLAEQAERMENSYNRIDEIVDELKGLHNELRRVVPQLREITDY